MTFLPSCGKELKSWCNIDTILPPWNHQLFVLHQRQEHRYLKKKNTPVQLVCQHGIFITNRSNTKKVLKFSHTTSRGAWSMSSKRIHWPLETACVSVPGCHTNFPGISVQRYIPSSICETSKTHSHLHLTTG